MIGGVDRFELLMALIALLAVAGIALSVFFALRGRSHRMCLDDRLDRLTEALHDKAAAADQRADELGRRIDGLGAVEARLRLLEMRDLVAELDRKGSLDKGQTARLASSIDRLRDDLRLEAEG